MKVYQHRRLTDNKIFYFGICSREDRPTSRNSRNRHWNFVVDKHGFKAEIIHECESRAEACYTEKYLIAYYGRKNLTNCTDGGDGSWGTQGWNKGVPRTDEVKEKLRAANLGKKLSEATKAKISKSHKGVKKSKEHVLNMSKAQKGTKRKPLDKEHRKKISLAQIGVKKKVNICPHCGKIGRGGAMKQWHFDNCKQINLT